MTPERIKFLWTVATSEFPLKICLLAYPGCLTSVISGLIDSFALASAGVERLHGPHASAFDTLVATADGEAVIGSGGFRIEADVAWTRLPPCDVAIVPPTDDRDVMSAIEREQSLVQWLQAAPQRPPLICSVCTGAFFFAAAGLLDGRRATTNAWYGDLLQRQFPKVRVHTQERLIEERSIISAGTTTAFLDLAIHLVDKSCGHDVAVWTAKALSRDKNFDDQRPYFLFAGPRDHGDAAVLALQDHLQQHYASPLSAEQLAELAAMSVRTLTRRFQNATGSAPMVYLRRLRLEAAKRLLETKNHKIESIACAVGYDDARAFVRAFHALAGISPSQYRLKFQRR